MRIRRPNRRLGLMVILAFIVLLLLGAVSVHHTCQPQGSEFDPKGVTGPAADTDHMYAG